MSYIFRTPNVPVPSLYVRVYRNLDFEEFARRCSLIICEGISDELRHRVLFEGLPHYM